MINRRNNLVLSVITTILTLILPTPLVFATASSGDQKINQILDIIIDQNILVKSAREAHLASKHIEHGSGFMPDPIIKLNFFGSPIETRNGPQKSNIMVTQNIPWPSTLRSEEQRSASMTRLKKEQIEAFILDLKFEAKSVVYKYAELSEKIESRNKMILTLNNLGKVVLSRIKLGEASQAEISRINIEIIKLTQNLRLIETKMMSLRLKLTSMTGGKDIVHLLPTFVDNKWGMIINIDPSKVNLSSHPRVLLAKAKIGLAQAELDQVKAKRLPKFGISASWFQIDEPNSAMTGPGAGKDAWAVGASVSIPIWSKKYDSMEYNQIARRSAAKYELSQQELDLRTEIKSTYEELQAANDISAMFRSDILPQANQALKADRESYTQGNVPFERVIENYIRVIKFEDQLLESQVKQATLIAAIEKLVGRSL